MEQLIMEDSTIGLNEERKGDKNIDNIDSFYDEGLMLKASKVFRAVNNSLRKKIIVYIGQNKKVNVTEIYNSLGIEQSVASQHLAVLRDAKIITPIRSGKFIFYTVNMERIKQISNLAKELI